MFPGLFKVLGKTSIFDEFETDDWFGSVDIMLVWFEDVVGTFVGISVRLGFMIIDDELELTGLL